MFNSLANVREGNEVIVVLNPNKTRTFKRATVTHATHKHIEARGGTYRRNGSNIYSRSHTLLVEPTAENIAELQRQEAEHIRETERRQAESLAREEEAKRHREKLLHDVVQEIVERQKSSGSLASGIAYLDSQISNLAQAYNYV